MANTSIYAAFERMWQHVVAAIGNKSDINHNHDDVYYTENEIDAMLENISSSGGDADTLDGKHADEFALASDVSELQTLIGDTTVSEQVDVALANIDNLVYVSEENQESTVVPLNADTLGGVPAVQYARMSNTTPRNLLDNSDFRNPVNQRGQTTYAVNGYGIDRWRQWDSSHSVTIVSGVGVKVEGGNLVTYVPAENIHDDTIYTYAAKDLNGDVFITSGTTASVISTNATSGLVPDTNKTKYGFTLAKDHTWVWAALYEGEYTIDTLPEYQPKGYGTELAECQRYFRKVKGSYLPSFTYDGGATVNSEIRIPMYLGAEMRIIPTATLVSAPTAFRYNGISVALTSASVVGMAETSTLDRPVIYIAVEPEIENGHSGYVVGIEVNLSADL